MKLRYKHQITQAYWAGYLTAVLYNVFQSRLNLPHITLCMRDFAHLKIVFGKYYTLLKNDGRTNKAILMYEKFDSIMDIPSKLKGSYSNFMLGYSDAFNGKKLDASDLSTLLLLDIPNNPSDGD